MILGYTLTTFPKSCKTLMHNQSNRNLWHNCKGNTKQTKQNLYLIVGRRTLHDSSLYMIDIKQTSNSDSWHDTTKLHAMFITTPKVILDKLVFLHKPVKLVRLQKYTYVLSVLLSVSICIICITVCFVSCYIVLSFYYDCLL